MTEKNQPEETNLLELTRGYDWRPIILFGLMLGFAGFAMWLYH